MVPFPKPPQVVLPHPPFLLILLCLKQMLNVVTLGKMVKSELGRVKSGEKTAFVEDVNEGGFSLHHGGEGEEDIAEEL